MSVLIRYLLTITSETELATDSESAAMVLNTKAGRRRQSARAERAAGRAAACRAPRRRARTRDTPRRRSAAAQGSQQLPGAAQRAAAQHAPKLGHLCARRAAPGSGRAAARPEPDGRPAVQRAVSTCLQQVGGPERQRRGRTLGGCSDARRSLLGLRRRLAGLMARVARSADEFAGLAGGPTSKTSQLRGAYGVRDERYGGGAAGARRRLAPAAAGAARRAVRLC